jgi:hypothetical protein
MARVHEEYVVIKLSKLVKDSDAPELVNEDMVAVLAQLLEGTVSEVIDDAGVIVEVEKSSS